MVIQTEQQNTSQYVKALTHVNEFIGKITRKPRKISELREYYSAYAELCTNIVNLFVAVILYPDAFITKHDSGLLNPYIQSLIENHPGEWNNTNRFYRNFMGLGINLVDREVNEKK